MNDLDGLVRLVDVTDSDQDSSSGNHVRLKLLDGTELELDTQEAWGDQALISRPADPDSNGGAEAAVIELGDELLGVGTRDARNIPNLEKGEAVLRALGMGNVARVWVKPDGSIILEAGGTTDFVALAAKVLTELNAIKTAFDTHTHPYAMGTTSAPSVPMPSPSSVAASKVKAE